MFESSERIAQHHTAAQLMKTMMMRLATAAALACVAAAQDQCYNCAGIHELNGVQQSACTEGPPSYATWARPRWTGTVAAAADPPTTSAVSLATPFVLSDRLVKTGGGALHVNM